MHIVLLYAQNFKEFEKSSEDIACRKYGSVASLELSDSSGYNNCSVFSKNVVH